MDLFRRHVIHNDGGGDADNLGEHQAEKDVASTEEKVTKKKCKPKKKPVVVDPTLEELYNKTLQESNIDPDGMEWEEKKELAEVLLLSKDDSQSVDVDKSEDVEQQETGPLVNKTETMVSRNSEDDTTHGHIKQSVQSCANIAQRTSGKIRKRPFDEMLGENKMVVSAEVHTEHRQGPNKGKKARKSSRQKGNIQEEIVPPRKKTRAEGAKNKFTAKNSCCGEMADDNMMETSSVVTSNGVGTASTTVVQNVYSKPSYESCADDPRQSYTKTDVTDLSSEDQPGAEVGQSVMVDDTSQVQSKNAHQKETVINLLDYDDDDATQPPDSPDLFRDPPTQIAASVNMGQSDNTERVECGDTGDTRSMESAGSEELSNFGAAHEGLPAFSRTRSEQPDQNGASQDANVTNPDSQGFQTSKGAEQEMEEESQSPKFKRMGASSVTIQDLPDKKLLRKYRKYEEKIRSTTPLFSPPSKDPVIYAKVILQLFDLYLRKVRLAQSEICSHVDWGVPVPVGRHMSRTLDIKKRGYPSFSWSDEDETLDDNEPAKNNSQSQTKPSSPVESLPDIPPAELLEDNLDPCEEVTEYLPLESTLQNEQTQDDDVYNADTEEACRGSSQGILIESVTNAVVNEDSNLTIAGSQNSNSNCVVNDDSNLTIAGSQSSNSILNSQGEIKPYQKRAVQQKDLIEVDAAVNIIVDSDSNESSNSTPVKKWTTLTKCYKKICSNTAFNKTEVTHKNNSDVKIRWLYDNDLQQMKRVDFESSIEAVNKTGDSVKVLDGNKVVDGDDDDCVLNKASVNPIIRSSSFQKQRSAPNKRTMASASRIPKYGGFTSSESDSESPVTKRSWKKPSRKSFLIEESDDGVETKHSAVSATVGKTTVSATAGKSAVHTSTSSECYSGVLDADNDAHNMQAGSQETISHVACPLCNKFFDSNHIEEHASECEVPVERETRKHTVSHYQDHIEDIGLRDDHAIAIHDGEDGIDGKKSVVRRSRKDSWESGEVDLSLVRKNVAQMKPRQTEVCMICFKEVPVGKQYERHVDQCIQAAIEKNETGNDDGNRRQTRSTERGSLMGQLESTWNQTDRTDASYGSRKKENVETSTQSRHLEEVIPSSYDGAASKDPNWLNTELDSPIKSFKRISELDEPCMDFQNQFKTKNKGEWKYLGRGRKRQRKK